jgi:predicted phage-related endonuclease
MSNYIKYIPKDREDWLRKKKEVVISGSVIAAIAGLSDYSTPFQTWCDIMGKVDPFTGNEFTDNGTDFEQGVVNKFERSTGNKIIKASEKDILYINKEYPFVGGTPDRMYKNILTNKKGIFEAKLTSKSITSIEDAPVGWVMQPKFYMGLLGLDDGAIAWVVTKFGLPLYYEYLKHDQDFFDLMLQVGINFYQEYVVKDIPPPIEKSCDVARMFIDKQMQDAIDISEEMFLTHKELFAKKQEIKALEVQADVLIEKIKASYRDNNGFKYNDMLVSTYKYSNPRTTVDTKKLQLEYPQVFEKVIKKSEPSRTLLLKLHNDE